MTVICYNYIRFVSDFMILVLLLNMMKNDFILLARFSFSIPCTDTIVPITTELVSCCIDFVSYLHLTN